MFNRKQVEGTVFSDITPGVSGSPSRSFLHSRVFSHTAISHSSGHTIWMLCLHGDVNLFLIHLERCTLSVAKPSTTRRFDDDPPVGLHIYLRHIREETVENQLSEWRGKGRDMRR
mmetsp:Transcript_37100/g.96185  ORF Transcript_37100/g.96185 Transcript_37100/m.96185 type:complete len:115 (-) Transcript_37100:3017-3361(-)